MNSQAMFATPDVTIIVSPRERFSYTRESLESIYEHTKYPFNLIYIDGGSPRHIKDYLIQQAEQKQFQIIRTDYYLSPNRARNIGLAQVTTKYVVFIDNDVVVTPDWLKPLVECAEETKATVVSPLICQYLPLHTEVHCAGGQSRVAVETPGETTRRRIIEKIYHQGRNIADVLSQLQRQETGLAEFHCMMVRTEIFEQIGFLDEKLLNTKEHIDFCILVTQAGGKVYLEPASLMTYVPTSQLELTDIPYYMLRWSDAWEIASLKHLREKWNITEDQYFKNKYNRLGWRRQMTIIKPLSQKLLFGKINSRVANKILGSVEKVINRFITYRYSQKYLSSLIESPDIKQDKSAITASK